MRQFFSVIFNYLNGNFAYENYLKHAQKNHPEKEVLSKKKFLQERVRGKKINRCCWKMDCRASLAMTEEGMEVLRHSSNIRHCERSAAIHFSAQTQAESFDIESSPQIIPRLILKH